MNKIKILFVAEELQTNGAMISLVSLLNALPKDKYDIALFLFYHGGEMMNQLPKSVSLLKESLPYKIHRLPLKNAIKHSLSRFRPDLAFFRGLVSFQRALKINFYSWSFLPKIVGDYDIACGYADGFIAPTIIKKVQAKKKVCWIHMPYSYYPQHPYIYKALKKADLCIPVSHDTGKNLEKVLQCKVPQRVIHNITDIELCKIRAKEPCEIPRAENINRIISVGRATPQKFFEVIPETAKKLKEKGVFFEWFIIGEGPLRIGLIDKVRELGLEEVVHFIGARSNPMPWIKSADVFVNPSRFEAWGMTVSEALCLGKAVITSDIPVFSEQIKNGVNGIMIKATPENIANEIEELLCNPQKRKYLEDNAKSYPFTKEFVIKEFNSMINLLLKK